MDMTLKTKFIESWSRHFNNAERPRCLYCTGAEGAAERAPRPVSHMCMVGVRARVRKSADVDSTGCGGRRYTEFTEEISPTFEYFLSCGLPGMFDVPALCPQRHLDLQCTDEQVYSHDH